jgi:hypothetical protein
MRAGGPKTERAKARVRLAGLPGDHDEESGSLARVFRDQRGTEPRLI